MSKPPKKPKIHVLTLAPAEQIASKPHELIQIRGHESLSLSARRAITILWHNAHRQGVAEGRTYRLQLSRLSTWRHKSRETVVETIEALMTTLVVVPKGAPSPRRGTAPKARNCVRPTVSADGHPRVNPSSLPDSEWDLASA
ncbi:hypothetical protein [Amaricoccus sp.]|uniref:hypothetical protein n=1 Tax=Amaricoccus sp. TaxID=1872485 RepID=UPI001B5FA32F|nr:hypothetical protein [Amaricoccus sp.]MBP7001610.1 hypothetical protein [Amaricoccus sp.]